MLKGTTFVTGVVLVLAVHGAAAQEKPVPEIWKEIEREAAGLAEFAGGYRSYVAQREIVVRRVAGHSDRSTVETLLRTAETPARIKDRHLQLEAFDLSARVMVAIVDPKNEHGMKCRLNELNRKVGVTTRDVSWYGVATAAIDVYHDDAARNLLLEVTFKALSDPSVRGHAFYANPAIYSLGFLRTYEAEVVRPRIEEALRAEETREHPKPPPLREPAGYLRALLSSLDYASQLKDPVERARYHDFERRLWRAWGLARRGFRARGMEFQDAARILDKHWKEGDERFLLRIFEDSTSTFEETQIAVYLGHRLSADGKRRLKTIADGTTRKAPFAQKALDLAARE